MGKLLLFFVSAVAWPATPNWLDWVLPIATPAEMRSWRAMTPSEREKFEENFWLGKGVTKDEYYRRVEHVDSVFGSGRRGSGANTDQGRVWLANGAPVRVARIPSSRIFVPLEIWYYDTIPGLLNTEVRLIFYQKNGVGVPKLYSPSLDTIRALLLPQAATRSMFGPNDSVTESSVRQKLRTGPAEDEIISASTGIAVGVRDGENLQLLSQIASPSRRLARGPLTASVKSKVIFARPPLNIFQSASEYGGLQVDLRLDTNAAHKIGLEVLADSTSIYATELELAFPKAEAVRYQHRLDLLPGSYRLNFTVDGTAYPYPLELAAHPNNFEALCVFAYVEERLQDYPVAVELYHRALKVQESPALRAALAKLPSQ